MFQTSGVNINKQLELKSAFDYMYERSIHETQFRVPRISLPFTMSCI